MKGLRRYTYTYVEKTPIEHEIDIMLSKKILHHLHVFFERKINNNTSNNTSNNILNNTIKNRGNKGKVKNKTVKRFKN
jgi:hypothetical protein